MKLSDLGEFGLIGRLTDGCERGSERIVRGIGDDCSVTRSAGGMVRLVTTDLLVEGVHFQRQAITSHQLGAKAMAVNLSDIAAMGGVPLDAHVSIAIPGDVSVGFLDELYAGMKVTARRHGVDILGGDTTRSRQDLVINIVVTGEVAETEVLYRRGAHPGDHLFVTGPLGDAGAGLDAILNDRITGDVARELVRRHLEPEPHLAQGRAIATSGLAHAMLDVSDGVASDVGHLCDESNVGCAIDLRRLPLSHELQTYCAEHGLEPTELALSAGEDYVLLVAGPPELTGVAGLTAIGVVTGDPAQRHKVLTTGEQVPLASSGWDHFR